MAKKVTLWAVRGPKGLIKSIKPETTKDCLIQWNAATVAEMYGCLGELWVRGMGGYKRAWKILEKNGYKAVKVTIIEV